jgi:hypothetical protein
VIFLYILIFFFLLFFTCFDRNRSEEGESEGEVEVEVEVAGAEDEGAELGLHLLFCFACSFGSFGEVGIDPSVIERLPEGSRDRLGLPTRGWQIFPSCLFPSLRWISPPPNVWKGEGEGEGEGEDEQEEEEEERGRRMGRMQLKQQTRVGTHIESCWQ